MPVYVLGDLWGTRIHENLGVHLLLFETRLPHNPLVNFHFTKNKGFVGAILHVSDASNKNMCVYIYIYTYIYIPMLHEIGGN